MKYYTFESTSQFQCKKLCTVVASCVVEAATEVDKINDDAGWKLVEDGVINIGDGATVVFYASINEYKGLMFGVPEGTKPK